MTIKSALNMLAALGVLALSVPSVHAAPTVTVTGQTAGVTPFISFVTLHVDNTNAFDHAVFIVQPKTGSVTRPISARYSRDYLLQRGYIHADTGEIVVPVFGLYAHRVNTVSLVTGLVDGNSQTSTVTIQTAAYHDACHKHPEVLQARTADTSLSYDFFLLKSFQDDDSPTIIDTDGEIRWVGTAGVNSLPAALYKNNVYVGKNAQVIRMEFDGTVTPLLDYTALGITAFHHNFDFGRDGLIAGVITTTDLEAVIIEFDVDGNILHTWNMADIISAAMVAGGDDPSQFITREADWFHNNAATYRASDNTLVVSSRENFVIAIDYDTSEIKWILGDPTKHWYEFPSLRKYALTLTPGTHPPIGQHAVSFFNDRLMLFDNGYASVFQMPPGANRTYSAPRKYQINAANLTAEETWNYVEGKQLYSPITSSVYEDQPGNYLIDYAVIGPFTPGPLVLTSLTHAAVRGVNASNQVVFNYEYTGEATATAGWNAVIVHLENMVFD